MPIDASIALQTKGIQLPDPMAQASSAMTLSNLGMQNQQMQFQMQAQRDVPAALALASTFKPGQEQEAMQAVSQQYPRAAMVVVPMIRDNALKVAQTGEASGKGEQARQTAYKEAATVLGNQVNAMLQAGQPLTPMQKQQLSMQAAHVASIGGHSANGVPDLQAPDDQWNQFAQALASSGVNPEQQASMRKTQALLPGELAQQGATLQKTGAETTNLGATTDKTRQEIAYAPQVLRNQTTSANASATGARASMINATALTHADVMGSPYTFNKQTGTMAQATGPDGKPISPFGQAGSTGLTGDALLGTLPPAIANQVKAMAEGRMAIPEGTALRVPINMLLKSLVSQYKPDFADADAKAQAATRVAFSTGEPAASVSSLNTLMGHLQSFDTSAKALNNTDYPLVNKAVNAIGSHVDPNLAARIDKYQVDKNAVISELTRVWRGTGGSEGDLERWASAVNDAQSPQAARAVMGEVVDLVKSRMESLGTQYNRGMRTTADPLTLLDPDKQKIFQSFQSGGGGAAAPSAGGWSIVKKP